MNLRISEVAYKLNLLEVALDALVVCEKVLSKDRHVINLLKGKIYDKKRHYSWAVEEYECALLIACELKLPIQITGSIKFRLGWSRIRSKRAIDQGVIEMKDAHKMLPENCEILLKLAGAIF